MLQGPKGGAKSRLAGATAGLCRWGLVQRHVLVVVADHARAGIQALIHLLADYVHQALKDLLDVDVVLGTGLKKFKPWEERKE